MRINWLDDNKPKTLYFNDLSVNDAFRNVGSLTKLAVYIKVDVSSFICDHGDEDNIPDYAMMEIQTGRIFTPTKSQVELVDVEVNVGKPKPLIYD